MCVQCDPSALLERAQASLERALRFDGAAADDVIDGMIAAESTAAAGDTRVAADLARRAAGACLVKGGGRCVEAVELLSELEDGAGDFSDDEIAAMLSLAPGASLSPAVCARAALLRLRLAGRFGDPAWADACGAVAHQGELGYRAAKAALLRGDTGGARARLAALDDAPAHAVRAQYLAAVADVVDGHAERARDGFLAIAALPPDPRRSAEDDEARVLAELQSARLLRELGRPDLALDAYQSVPAGGVGRAAALVEGAATAAFLGDPGLARVYLEASALYGSDMAAKVEVMRLLASLDLVAGKHDDALAGFRKLSGLGRDMRQKVVPDAATAEVSLAADPSLGGLLDPKDARRIRAVEDDLGRLTVELDRSEREIARLGRELEHGGPHTANRRALDHVDDADRLLRMAEAAFGLDVGPPVAGPARTSTTAAEMFALRRQIDVSKARFTKRWTRERDDAARLLRAIESEVETQRALLQASAKSSRPVLAELKRTLVERALRAVTRLEMSEETGALEIAWRRKVDASIELRRLTVEYETDRKDLESNP